MSLLPYCNSDKQKQYAQAVEEHKSEMAAARALGIDRDALRSSLKSVKRRYKKALDDAKQGQSPDYGLPHKGPEGYEMAFLTATYNNKTGELERMWPRFKPSQGHLDQLRQDFFDELPRIDVQQFHREDYDTDTVRWFQIGDGHIGMLADKSQAMNDFNLDIAERELCKAMAIQIDEGSYTERCVIHDLGDMSHYENNSGITDRGGHPLDISGTLPQMIRCRNRIMRFIIDRALTKHKYVDVIVNQGNHSRALDYGMVDFLTAVYERTDRVTTLNNDSIIIPYRMGNTFVVTTHTDKLKPKDVAGLMAEYFGADWGETRYHYIDGGHVHHRQVAKEYTGAIYESWNQIAPNDRHATEAGYGSRQCLSAVDRSKTYGEESRRTLSIERVKDIMNNVAPGTEAKKRRPVYTV